MKNASLPWCVANYVPGVPPEEPVDPEDPPVDPWDAIPAISITSTGAAFAPRLHLHDGATAEVRWTLSDSTTSNSLTPVVDFGTAASRSQSLKVNPLSAIEALNFGYDNQEDGGAFHTEASYDHTPTPISALAGLQTGAPNLMRLLVSHAEVTALDLSGLDHLEIVEAFNARPLARVDFTGCTALRRVCFEGDNLASVDLRDAVAIEDVRCRGQGISQGYTGNFELLLGDVTHLWHLCFGTQMSGRVSGLDGIFNGAIALPAIVEFWPWDAHIGGVFALNAPNSTLRSVWGSGCDFTAVDCSNITWASTGTLELFLGGNPLTAIDLTGCERVAHMQFPSCGLTQALVDYVLGYVASQTTTGGEIDLRNNAAPSATGLAHVATLQGRGFTVYVAT